MFVSAKYATINPNDPTIDPNAEIKPVLATDDQGLVWSFNEDSQLGDWLRYKEEGGTIDSADPWVEPEEGGSSKPAPTEPPPPWDGFQPNPDDNSTMT